MLMLGGMNAYIIHSLKNESYAFYQLTGFHVPNQ